MDQAKHSTQGEREGGVECALCLHLRLQNDGQHKAAQSHACAQRAVISPVLPCHPVHPAETYQQAKNRADEATRPGANAAR